MNKEIQDRWVAALRSGEYKQGKYRLQRDDDTYCCLGVLCDLAVKDGVVAAFDGRRELPPTTLSAWAGSSGWWRSGGVSLPSLNDGLGWTFDQIADHIEKYGVE